MDGRHDMRPSLQFTVSTCCWSVVLDILISKAFRRCLGLTFSSNKPDSISWWYKYSRRNDTRVGYGQGRGTVFVRALAAGRRSGGAIAPGRRRKGGAASGDGTNFCRMILLELVVVCRYFITAICPLVSGHSLSLAMWSLKMRKRKMQDRKIRHRNAGVENAGLDNARPGKVWNTASFLKYRMHIFHSSHLSQTTCTSISDQFVHAQASWST